MSSVIVLYVPGRHCLTFVSTKQRDVQQQVPLAKGFSLTMETLFWTFLLKLMYQTLAHLVLT